MLLTAKLDLTLQLITLIPMILTGVYCCNSCGASLINLDLARFRTPAREATTQLLPGNSYLVYRLEPILTGSTPRTDPILGQVLKSRPCFHGGFFVTYSRIVHVAANGTLIPGHALISFLSLPGISRLCKWAAKSYLPSSIHCSAVPPMVIIIQPPRLHNRSAGRLSP